MSSAFSDFTRVASVEAQALPPASGAGRPLLALTRGLAATAGGTSAGMPLPGASGGSTSGYAATAKSQLTLPDGRLHVGTHLGLMAGRYRYLSTLGEGVSAQVILAEDTLAATTGQLVAIKAMRRQHALAGQREARALRFLHAAAPGGAAPGLVRLLDTFQLGAHFCLVTERLFPGLLDWVASSAELPPGQAIRQLRKMAHQLLVSLAFMHSQGIVNADIKPDNILFCSPPGGHSVALRLVDLGNSFSLTETDRSAVAREMQSLPYRAPEAALGLPYGAPIDLFSLGVVLAEMALKRALFPCATPRDLLCQMASLLGPMPDAMVQSSALGRQIGAAVLCQRPADGAAAPAMADLPAELAQRVAAAAATEGAARRRLQLPAPTAARTCQLCAELAAVDASLADLVLRMLSYDPAQRITAQQALLHPFFDSLCPLRAVFPPLGDVWGHRPEAAPEAGPAGGVLPAGAPPLPAATMGPGSTMPLSPGLPTAVAAAAQAEAAEAVGAALQAAEAKAALQQPRMQQQPSLNPRPPQQQHAGSLPWHVHQQQQHQQQEPQPVQQRPQTGHQPPRHAAQEPAFSVQASTRQQHGWSPRREQPWRPPVLPPPEQATRLPAAQLAASQREEQRRLAAAQPYAGSFSPRFEPTPGRGQEQVAAQGRQDAQQQAQQAAQDRQGRPPQHASQEPDGQQGGGTPQSAPRHSAAAAADAAAAVGETSPEGKQSPRAAREAGGGGRSRGSLQQRSQLGTAGRSKQLPEGKPALSEQQQAAEATVRAFDLLLDAAATEAGDAGPPPATGSAGEATSSPTGSTGHQRQRQKPKQGPGRGRQRSPHLPAGHKQQQQPAVKAAKPAPGKDAKRAAAGAQGTAGSGGKSGIRQQQEKAAAKAPRKSAAGSRPTPQEAPSLAAQQLGKPVAADAGDKAEAAAAWQREQSRLRKQQARVRRAEEQAQEPQQPASGQPRERPGKGSSPGAAAAAVGATPPRKAHAKAAAASTKAAAVPAATTPAAKRKRAEPSAAAPAAAMAAKETAGAAHEVLGSAAALPAEAEMGAPPATAAKRQRRGRQPGDKPWWVA